MSKKILAIFDLSRTLLLAEKLGKQQYFDKRAIFETLKPDDSFGNLSIFWRNGREEFLDFMMTQKSGYFDVAVWSSCDREKSQAFCKSFFGKHYRNLLFVSIINREQYEGVQREYSPEPIAIQRDLSQIKTKFPQYDLNNIMVISNYANKSELHRFNDIIIPKYDPNIVDIKSDQTLQALCKYINGISILYSQERIQDVRTALRAKTFKGMDSRLQHISEQYKEYI